MPITNKKMTMTIDSRLDNVALVGMAVRGISEQLSLDSECVCHLELCVVEAVNNSISHAYHKKPGHEVTIIVELQADRIIFQISDNGKGFDPHLLDSTQIQFDPGDIDTLPTGGMGLPLMKQVMDQVRYEHTDGKSTLTLVKKLS